MFTAFKILRNLIWGIVFCAKAASVTDVFETFAQIYIEYIENIDWTIYRWWRKQSSVSIGYYPILSLRSALIENILIEYNANIQGDFFDWSRPEKF